MAARTGSTTGTLTWWDRKGGRWVAAGSAKARFGANGLAEGTTRKQGTNTTPTGLYGLPYAFGIEAAPSGTRYSYRPVRQNSWWCQDNDSRVYNRWTEPRAADCRASRAEHLITYRTQYAHALVVDFNYRRPVPGRGAGIFLHVNGRAPRRVACPCRRARCGRSCAGPTPRGPCTSRSGPPAGAPRSPATEPGGAVTVSAEHSGVAARM